MNITFVPELDGSNELEPEDTTLHQEMAGMLQWATESGRVDILHEIPVLSQHRASPWINHTKQLLAAFSCLECRCELSPHMDPHSPDVDESNSCTARWSSSSVMGKKSCQGNVPGLEENLSSRQLLQIDHMLLTRSLGCHILDTFHLLTGHQSSGTARDKPPSRRVLSPQSLLQ